MQDLIGQVLTIIRRMWKYRWLGLGASWLVALVGGTVAFQVPDQFEATARIYVDTDSILKPLMSGLTVQPNIEQQIGMLSRTLISRPNVEKLIRMADLDLKADSKAKQEDLIESLTKRIQIRSTARDNLYSLAFRDADKDKAKRVIQSLVSIFVESSLGASRKDTDSAKTFLNEQIKSYEAKLEEAEARLKEFKLRNLDVQFAEGKDAASSLSAVAAQLEQAKLELREAENARDAARQQINAEKNQAGSSVTQSLLQESATSIATPEIDGRIETQKRNLDALLQRFTDQHPDVIITRKLIKDLEEQKRKEVAELRKNAPAAGGGSGVAAGSASSLAIQELNRVAANAEVQVASLRARVAEYSSRLAAARAALKTAPQVEAEAAQLNRDYAIIKKNYEDLVARRQAAVMSGELDVASGIADFRLIDPPLVSPRPVSPNRLLLLGAAFAAALAVGVFVAFAATQLRPVFDAAGELRAKTALPVLGVVSAMLGDADLRAARVDRLRFLAGSGGLLVSFGLALATLLILAARQAG